MKHQPFEPSFFYHVYNRGNNKEPIFKEEDNYNYFLGLVKKYLVPVVEIYSYCLLPNHFHFILQIKDSNELPEKIRTGESRVHQPFSNLFNAYTKAFNKKYIRSGSLFQEHLKRIKIEDEEYLRNLIIYVNTNPSHHSLTNYSDYKHSSYQGLISNSPTLLKRKEVLDLFDGVDNFEYVLQYKKVDEESLEKMLLE